MAAATKTLLAYEGFQYSAGSVVVGQNGGTGWSGAWFKDYGAGGNPTVVASSLSYSNLTTLGNRMQWGSGGNTINGVGRDLPLINNGLVYLQFIGNFSSQSLGGGTPHIRLFKPDSTLSGGIGNSGGPYLAILDSSLSTSATSQSSVSGNSQALMVVRINYHDVRTEMWVNPNLSTFDYASPPLPNATYTGLAPEFSRLAPYIKSPSSVDEISIYRMSTPQATTNAATSVTAEAATLNATVNDNGDAVAVSFDYGTTSAYGSNVGATTGGTVPQGAGNTAASVSLSGLICGSTYHYRVRASYAAGTSIQVKGADQSFTTLPCPPSLTGVGVSNVTTTTAQLNATASQSARGYWMLLAQGATPPSAAQLRAGVSYSGGQMLSAGNAAMVANLPAQFSVTGLVEGSNYQLYLMAEDAALNPSGVVSAAFSTLGVAGVCGSAQSSTLLTMPSAPQQCSAGTASLVTSAPQDWQWACSGSLGVASCTAAKPRTATGTGTASVAVVNPSGWVLDEATSAGFIPLNGHPQSPSVSPPPGVSFPHGLMEFKLTSGAANSTASVAISYPSPLPPGTVYWKYGPEPGNLQPHWYVFPGAVVSSDRRTITLTIQDGGQGDSDLATPSRIVDPGGPGVTDPQSIPTLQAWQLALLMTLLGLAGARFARKATAG
jgi:hypothetical protein